MHHEDKEQERSEMSSYSASIYEVHSQIHTATPFYLAPFILFFLNTNHSLPLPPLPLLSPHPP